MNDFDNYLKTEFGVTARRLEGRAIRDFFRQWHEAFFANVKRSTRKWVYRGIHWHAYSYSIEEAICGTQAVSLFQATTIEPFYLFHETRDQVFQCVVEQWPDFQSVKEDLYIVPCSLQWMFVTTHEISLGLGPYFAYPASQQ